MQTKTAPRAFTRALLRFVSLLAVLLPSAAFGQSTAHDVTAAITDLYGATPASSAITVFGQDVPLGAAVSANLDVVESAGILPFDDPLPARSYCIGPRNYDRSVISRVSYGTGSSVALHVQVVGSSGSMPGSAGYVQITNPYWMIDKVLASNVGGPGAEGFTAPATHDSGGNVGKGYGLRIDRVNGRIEWCGGGSCTSCACPENEVNFLAVLRPRQDAQPLFSLNLAETTAYPGSDSFNVGASFLAGNTGGSYVLTLSVVGAGAPMTQIFPFDAAPGQAISVPSLLAVSTAGLPPSQQSILYLKWNLIDVQALRSVLDGTDYFHRTTGPTASCP